jgi:hypothetical protein
MTHSIPTNYGQLLGEVKQRIRFAQYEALKAVNKELIALYWDIGRLICNRQQTSGWGKSVVEQLAKRFGQNSLPSMDFLPETFGECGIFT